MDKYLEKGQTEHENITIKLAPELENSIKNIVWRVFEQHGVELNKNILLNYLPSQYYLDENGQKQRSDPLFNANNQTIYIALSSLNYPREQFVFQFSHECVHQYFSSPWDKESDTSWLAEFVAATTSYAVCDELGGRFSEYLQLCLHYNFDSVQAALPRFLEKIGKEYREHPSHVYCDEIRMPCLYYREHGSESWKYLFEAYDIVKQSLADTLGLRLLFNA